MEADSQSTRLGANGQRGLALATASPWPAAVPSAHNMQRLAAARRRRSPESFAVLLQVYSSVLSSTIRLQNGGDGGGGWGGRAAPGRKG
jgi:hypothetical protein